MARQSIRSLLSRADFRRASAAKADCRSAEIPMLLLSWCKCVLHLSKSSSSEIGIDTPQNRSNHFPTCRKQDEISVGHLECHLPRRSSCCYPCFTLSEPLESLLVSSPTSSPAIASTAEARPRLLRKFQRWLIYVLNSLRLAITVRSMAEGSEEVSRLTT